MSETIEIKNTDTLTDKRYRIEFDEPYFFETKEHTGVDLSGIGSITTNELLTAERMYIGIAGSSEDIEGTLLYSLLITSIVCKLPIEFFEALPGKESLKIKKKVSRFFRR